MSDSIRVHPNTSCDLGGLLDKAINNPQSLHWAQKRMYKRGDKKYLQLLIYKQRSNTQHCSLTGERWFWFTCATATPSPERGPLRPCNQLKHLTYSLLSVASLALNVNTNWLQQLPSSSKQNQTTKQKAYRKTWILQRCKSERHVNNCHLSPRSGLH